MSAPLGRKDLDFAVLCILSDHLDKGFPELSTNVVAHMLNSSDVHVQFALHYLSKAGLVRENRGSSGSRLYEITDTGYFHVEDKLKNSMVTKIMATVEPSRSDSAASPVVVSSSAWTGLPVEFELTEEKRVNLVRLLDHVEQQLSSLGLSQSEQAQARAYIVATRVLAEAPKPPSDLIWALIGQANAVAGVASLLVSIVALFAAAH